MILTKKRLKILSLLIGISYFSLFFCFLQAFSIFNLFGLLLFVLSFVLFCIAVYIIQQSMIHHDRINELIVDKEVIKNRFNECNQTVNSMLDHVTDGIALLNLQLDFFKTNKKFCEILGYTPEKILTWNLDEIVSLSFLSKHQLGINQLMNGKIESYSFKKKFIKKSTEIIWLSIVLSLIRDSNRKPHYFVMYLHNLTSQKLAEDHLSYLTFHDALTKLPNRHQFEKEVSQLLKSQNHQKKFCLLLIDLDNFKNINNTVGYEIGNILLQKLAETIKTVMKQSNLLARLNSDEFALVMTDKVSHASISHVAELLLREIANPIYLKKHALYITASIGISVYPDDGFTTRKLMKHADIALHHAKSHDKNNYQFYSTDLARNEKLKLKAKNILARSLVTDQLSLQYQIRQKAINHQIIAVNAMVCLMRANDTLFNIEEMLTRIDETGFAIPIHDWMIKTACKQLNIWQESISTNVVLSIRCDAKQISHPDFAKKMLKTINELNITATSLALEVTGLDLRFFREQTDHAILQAFLPLQHAGINFILCDDANVLLSLDQTKKYFFDKLIINTALTKQLLSDDIAAMVVRAIIEKAHKMNIQTIAEGIETAEQITFLTNAGCDELQGNVIASPVTGSELIAMLKQSIEAPFAYLS